MKLSGIDVALLVDDYVEQAEYESLLTALKATGALVTVVGAGRQQFVGLASDHETSRYQADKLIDEVQPSSYRALVVTGGIHNANHLRTIQAVKDWVIDFQRSYKPILTLSYGPWVLASADIVENRRITGSPTIREDLTNAGAAWVDLPIVVDDNILSARTPADIPELIKALSAL